jgi:hypothetical protein
MQSINRRIVCLNLRDGTETVEYSMTKTTLPQYIRAINNLNKSAYVYGVVYLPYPYDEEYAAYIAD